MLLSFPRPCPYGVFSKQTCAEKQSQADKAKNSVSTAKLDHAVFIFAI